MKAAIQSFSSLIRLKPLWLSTKPGLNRYLRTTSAH
jgi:hypothetical protein